MKEILQWYLSLDEEMRVAGPIITLLVSGLIALFIWNKVKTPKWNAQAKAQRLYVIENADTINASKAFREELRDIARSNPDFELLMAMKKRKETPPKELRQKIHAFNASIGLV